MMDLKKLSEAELLALAKTSEDLDELDAIASIKKLPRKVALEICKRKDPIANAAKITIASSIETDDDILLILLDDLPGIEKTAWSNIEKRIEKRKFKNKDAYYDIADLAISQWKSGRGAWLLSFKALAQIFKDFEDFREDIVEIPGALKDSEIKSLAAKYGVLNESKGVKMKEKEALEIVKRTNNGAQLTELVDDMDLPKKVRLEIAKRKDSTAYRAKLALTDKMYTEEDILWMLIDDSNSDVSARAFTALCNRMTWTSAGIKDKDVRDDFIEYVIEFGEKTKMDDYHLSKHLMQQCLKFSKHPEVVKALRKLMAMAGWIRLNESDESDDCDLLEASYIQLAKQTSSQSQLQKLAESQFESVRDIAKSRL
jgi:hypothetical protein